MKLNKTLLRRMIREAMAESDEKASKLTTRTMTGGQFVAKGREDRVDADPEVDNNERALLDQISKFLLGLASKPGVNLQDFRMQLQTQLQRIDALISKKAKPDPATPQGEQV